ELLRQIFGSESLRSPGTRVEPDLGYIRGAALPHHGLLTGGEIDAHQRSLVPSHGAQQQRCTAALFDDQRPQREAVFLAVLENALPPLGGSLEERTAAIRQCFDCQAGA